MGYLSTSMSIDKCVLRSYQNNLDNLTISITDLVVMLDLPQTFNNMLGPLPSFLYAVLVCRIILNIRGSESYTLEFRNPREYVKANFRPRTWEAKNWNFLGPSHRA